MNPIVHRLVVLAVGVVGGVAGWLLGTAFFPNYLGVTATVGAFLGVVVAGIALAAREYDESDAAEALQSVQSDEENR